MPRDRPEHAVRAAAHHPDRLAAVVREPRLERARDQPLVADRAVLGGEEAARGPSPPSRAAGPDRARRGRRRSSPIGQPGRAPPPAPPACTSAAAPRRPRPGGRSCRRSGSGKLVPSGPRTSISAPGSARSSSAVPRPTVLARISARPPGADRHQGEGPGQERVAPPSPSNHYELSGLGGGQRLAADEPQNEVTASK